MTGLGVFASQFITVLEHQKASDCSPLGGQRPEKLILVTLVTPQVTSVLPTLLLMIYQSTIIPVTMYT